MKTPHLSITHLFPYQAQKELTVNEALIIIDALQNTGVIAIENTPPTTPNEGDVYIIGQSPTGDWQHRVNHIAYYVNHWRYLTPNQGITLWIISQKTHLTYDGTSWKPLPTLGINATADSTNRLAVKSDAILFDHSGKSTQVKINKNNAADTSSLLFQQAYTTHAEIGLIQTNDLMFKTTGRTMFQNTCEFTHYTERPFHHITTSNMLTLDLNLSNLHTLSLQHDITLNLAPSTSTTQSALIIIDNPQEHTTQWPNNFYWPESITPSTKPKSKSIISLLTTDSGNSYFANQTTYKN